MNPLKSIAGAITTGVVIALILAFAYQPSAFNELGAIMWLHVLAGIMWIGLLFYFNVAQIPALAAATADTGGPGGAGIAKYVAPRALFWFRWAALVTWLAGAWYLLRSDSFLSTFSLGLMNDSTQALILGTGVWLGTIMLFNVWVLIWPNQKKVLGITPATDAEKARARTIALNASRLNFVLSIPMLMCMIGPSHGLPF